MEAPRRPVPAPVRALFEQLDGLRVFAPMVGVDADDHDDLLRVAATDSDGDRIGLIYWVQDRDPFREDDGEYYLGFADMRPVALDSLGLIVMRQCAQMRLTALYCPSHGAIVVTIS